MSHYYTKYCAEHGDYDADVDGDYECPQCVKEGKTPMQKLERENTELKARIAELETDARRWQWLRNNTGAVESVSGHRFSFPIAQIHAQPTRQAVNLLKGSVAEHLDAAIDAQISQNT